MFDFKLDANDLDACFDRISKNLFQNYCLCTGDKRYFLTEIEFYYNRFSENKIDNFAHVHGAESPEGTWRLHGAGVDIAFKGKDYYGGILIRGMESEDGHVIDGPWNTASLLVRNLASVWKSVPSFHFQKLDNPRATEYQKSSRVGLRLRKASDLEYICKPWRYLSWPTKTKKGRHTVALQLHHDGKKEEIETLGFAKRTVEGYIRNFKKGKEMEVEEFVNAKNGVSTMCMMFGKYIAEYVEKK